MVCVCSFGPQPVGLAAGAGFTQKSGSSKMTDNRPGFADYALLLVLGLVWGSSFLFIKFGVETIPAATLTLSRLAIAAVLLLIVARAMGQSLQWRKGLWIWLLLAALVGNALPFTLIAWGQEEIDSGVSAILMAVMPLSTLIMAHIFTADEKITAIKFVGVVLGFTGIAVLIGPDKLANLGSDVWRQLAVAGAATCYGLNAVISKQLIGQPPHAMVGWLMVLSALMVLPFALVRDQPWALNPSTVSLWSTLILSIFHTAIGTLMLFLIIRRQGATFFSQINFLIPVIGVFYGVTLLGEQLGSGAYVALALILIGIAVARYGAASTR